MKFSSIISRLTLYNDTRVLEVPILARESFLNTKRLCG